MKADEKLPMARVPVEQIQDRIFLVRGHRVMLDRDLAEVYGVSTGRLNEQVRRNRKRFPADFLFQLTLAEAGEVQASRSQNAILKRGQNIKFAPFAFTEHGAVMLASVLNSPIAVEASIHVVRAFIQLRGVLSEHRELSRRLDDLERRHDSQFKAVFDAIRQLMTPPPEAPMGRIGFHRP